MILIDESFDGRTITIRVGETVELALVENASTGYRWCLPSDRQAWRTVLRLIEESAGAENARPGISATRRLLFEASAAGDAVIELEYQRPWQRPAPPARAFRLHVEVGSGDL